MNKVNYNNNFLINENNFKKIKTGFIISIFLLLFFSIFNFASNDLQSLQQSPLGNHTFLITAVMVNFFFACLAYFASKITQNELIKNYATSEFTNTITTIILLSVILFVTYSFSRILSYSLMQSVDVLEPISGISMEDALRTFDIGNQEPYDAFSNFDYYYEISFIYFDSITRKITQISNIIAEITVLLNAIARSSASSMSTPGLEGELSRNLLPPLNQLLKNLFTVNFLYYFFENLIIFFRACSLTILLPIGLVLRIFPITRGGGAFIMALAISFQFVFPMSFILFMSKYTFMNQTDYAITTIYELENELDIFPSPCYGSYYHQSVGEGLGDALSSRLSPRLLQSILGFVRFELIKIIFAGAVSAIFTYSSIHSLTGIFGANIPEVGKGLFKII